MDPDEISRALGRAISGFDDSITSDFMAMFPNGVDRLNPRQLRAVMTTPDRLKLLRCTRGTTVLVTLLDPSRERLWVANLGDCEAGMYS